MVIGDFHLTPDNISQWLVSLSQRQEDPRGEQGSSTSWDRSVGMKTSMSEEGPADHHFITYETAHTRQEEGWKIAKRASSARQWKRSGGGSDGTTVNTSFRKHLPRGT